MSGVHETDPMHAYYADISWEDESSDDDAAKAPCAGAGEGTSASYRDVSEIDSLHSLLIHDDEHEKSSENSLALSELLSLESEEDSTLAPFEELSTSKEELTETRDQEQARLNSFSRIELCKTVMDRQKDLSIFIDKLHTHSPEIIYHKVLTCSDHHVISGKILSYSKHANFAEKYQNTHELLIALCLPIIEENITTYRSSQCIELYRKLFAIGLPNELFENLISAIHLNKLDDFTIDQLNQHIEFILRKKCFSLSKLGCKELFDRYLASLDTNASNDLKNHLNVLSLMKAYQYLHDYLLEAIMQNVRINLECANFSTSCLILKMAASLNYRNSELIIQILSVVYENSPEMPINMILTVLLALRLFYPTIDQPEIYIDLLNKLNKHDIDGMASWQQSMLAQSLLHAELFYKHKVAGLGDSKWHVTSDGETTIISREQEKLYTKLCKLLGSSDHLYCEASLRYGLTVDILFSNGETKKVIEYNGPSHYLISTTDARRELIAQSRYKERVLLELGFEVLQVDYKLQYYKHKLKKPGPGLDKCIFNHYLLAESPAPDALNVLFPTQAANQKSKEAPIKPYPREYPQPLNDKEIIQRSMLAMSADTETYYDEFSPAHANSLLKLHLPRPLNSLEITELLSLVFDNTLTSHEKIFEATLRRVAFEMRDKNTNLAKKHIKSYLIECFPELEESTPNINFLYVFLSNKASRARYPEALEKLNLIHAEILATNEQKKCNNSMAALHLLITAMPREINYAKFRLQNAFISIERTPLKQSSMRMVRQTSNHNRRKLLEILNHLRPLLLKHLQSPLNSDALELLVSACRTYNTLSCTSVSIFSALQTYLSDEAIKTLQVEACRHLICFLVSHSVTDNTVTNQLIKQLCLKMDMAKSQSKSFIKSVWHLCNNDYPIEAESRIYIRERIINSTLARAPDMKTAEQLRNNLKIYFKYPDPSLQWQEPIASGALLKTQFTPDNFMTLFKHERPDLAAETQNKSLLQHIPVNAFICRTSTALLFITEQDYINQEDGTLRETNPHGIKSDILKNTGYNVIIFDLVAFNHSPNPITYFKTHFITKLTEIQNRKKRVILSKIYSRRPLETNDIVALLEFFLTESNSLTPENKTAILAKINIGMAHSNHATATPIIKEWLAKCFPRFHHCGFDFLSDVLLEEDNDELYRIAYKELPWLRKEIFLAEEQLKYKKNLHRLYDCTLKQPDDHEYSQYRLKSMFRIIKSQGCALKAHLCSRELTNNRIELIDILAYLSQQLVTALGKDLHSPINALISDVCDTYHTLNYTQTVVAERLHHFLTDDKIATLNLNQCSKIACFLVTISPAKSLLIDQILDQLHSHVKKFIYLAKELLTTAWRLLDSNYPLEDDHCSFIRTSMTSLSLKTTVDSAFKNMHDNLLIYFDYRTSPIRPWSQEIMLSAREHDYDLKEFSASLKLSNSDCAKGMIWHARLNSIPVPGFHAPSRTALLCVDAHDFMNDRNTIDIRLTQKHSIKEHILKRFGYNVIKFDLLAYRLSGYSKAYLVEHFVSKLSESMPVSRPPVRSTPAPFAFRIDAEPYVPKSFPPLPPS